MVQLITALFLLLASPAWSATYYVATNGSNSNDGLTESTPKLTVAHCVSIMVAGDTCLVKNGTYNEGVIRFSRTGTQAAPIKLLNYPGHAPKIQFNDPESLHRILIQHSSGQNVAMGWITIEGFELTNGHDGIKYHNLHNATIAHNKIHTNTYMGILGIGGHHITFSQNIFYTNGRYAACAAQTTTLCQHDHGIYAHGKHYTITNNLFYNNIGFGVQQNGSSTSSYSASVHASTEFAGAQNWIVSDNTFAYSYNRGGYVVWGGSCDDTRIENNIFYENSANRAASPQGIEFVGAGGSTGVFIRNNHYYASGSGGTVGIGSNPPADLVTSGNVTNVSPPAFVNGGTNSLPASPDFRLTASAPVNIALANEFPNTSENVVGAFKTLANPTLSMTANKIIGTFNTVTPIQNLSTAGVSVNCTGSACPVSPSVASVTPIADTDSQFEVAISGITGNACESLNQTWTLSYNSASGTWTASDNIGPHPGLHQKVFSFTNLPITNNCTGSGPSGYPAGYYLLYPLDEGTGTTATNVGSAGSGGNGTLMNGVSWVSGGGVSITGGTTQNISIPHGNGIDPSADDFTVGFTITIPAGEESLSRTVFGVPFVSGQRWYISMLNGTWRLGIQNSSDATAGDLAVTAGPQHICVQNNAGTNTVTLYKNGIASTSAGSVKSVSSSYTLPGNFELGRLPNATNGPNAEYNHFIFYQSVEDCNTIYQATQAPPADPLGVFSQTAVQFEAVYLPELGGSPTILPSPSDTKKVIQGGGVAITIQIECNDCDSTAFRLEARDNGAGNWLHVPDMETSDNAYMWGASNAAFLNSGAVTDRVLENGCTIVNGSTQQTSLQIPQRTLPASGCTMLRYLVRVRAGASGYTEFRLAKEGGVEFSGSYVLGRIDIIDEQAGGVGF